MENTIKFFWNGIKVNGKLNKFRFHMDSINYGVNFYGDDYAAEMPKECGVVVINNSDSMTDYFEKDHGHIDGDHPLCKFFAHAARMAKVHYAKAQIKQNEKMAKKYGYDYSVQNAACEREIAEAEIWENPGQPTAEDFEKVAEYIAEKKAKAEAEKKAEEEREEKERAAAREHAKTRTADFIKEFETAFPLVEGAPVVEVPFSEFCGLYDVIDAGEARWSVAAADKILGAIDDWQHRVRVGSKYYGWYHKTDFVIKWTENGEEHRYEGRYDLGDGEGGMLAHIRNFGEWYRTHEEHTGKELENPPETNDVLEMVKKFEAFAA